MKKLTIISMAALLLLAASCKKEKKTEAGGDAVFRATTETHSGDSKTQLVNKAVNWISGDAIKVFNASGTDCEFTAVSGGSSTTSFGGTAPDDFFGSTTPSYTAFYPYSEDVKLEEGSYKITLPDTQTYAENSFGPGANPMAAKSKTTELSFKNICGLLKLQLYAEEEDRYVKSITLKSNKSDNKSDEMLWGKGSVTFSIIDDEEIPSLSNPLADGGNTLTLDCSDYNNHQGVTLSISESSPTVFYFVVPSGTLAGGFTVTVIGTDGKPILIKAARANTDNMIQRSKITAMPALKVAPIGALPGVFSISESQQVFFSKGNLQYRAKGGEAGDASETAGSEESVGGTWRFAEHQYDFVGGIGTHYGNVYVKNADGDDVRCSNLDASATYIGWIDLFGWGTSGYNYKADVCYQPWSTSTTTANYGPSSGVLTDKSDWGYNCIINGGNKEKSGWFNITSGTGSQWKYLMYTRTTTVKGITSTNPRYCGIKVNLEDGTSMPGVLIFPDYFEWTDAMGTVPGQINNISIPTTYTKNNFEAMEAAGAVLLPYTNIRLQAGGRDGYGYYWTPNSGKCYFFNNSMHDGGSPNNHEGLSVRLVKNAN